MTESKSVKPKKKVLTAYINESVLEEWRLLVTREGKFYSSAMEEAMLLWVEKVRAKQLNK